MNVILLEKVHNLGNLGDTVKVKSGYGRNFLLPQGKAVSATAANIAKFESRRAELEKTAADKLVAAEARKAKLDGLSITISRVAGEEGKLFGSVGTVDIARGVTEAGVELAKSEVRLPQGVLRSVGEYDILIELHGDVSAMIKVIVVAE